MNCDVLDKIEEFAAKLHPDIGRPMHQKIVERYGSFFVDLTAMIHVNEIPGIEGDDKGNWRLSKDDD